jgi:DNA-repair protein complementing XP-A cells
MPSHHPDSDDPEQQEMGNQDNQRCKDCGSLDVSVKFLEIYSLVVCKPCIKSSPDRYSLLTKTEVKQDYLLTESELKELPCWTKPNPLSKTYSNMLLYARCQVEDFALKKYGSLEALDEEFSKREALKDHRKKLKFKKKSLELRKKTLLQGSSSAVRTSSSLLSKGKDLDHEHCWGTPEPVEKEDGDWEKQTCSTCGLDKIYEVF